MAHGRPVLCRFREDPGLVFLVCLENGCVQEHVELAVDDVGKTWAAVKFLAKSDTQRAVTAVLGHVLVRGRCELFHRLFGCEIIGDAVMHMRVLGASGHNSQAVGMTLADLDLDKIEGITLLAISRAGEVKSKPNETFIMEENDILFFLGQANKLNELYNQFKECESEK